MRAAAPSKILSPEGSGDLVSTPVHLHIPTIYILINSYRAVVYIVVFLLALLEHLEDQVTADGGVVSIAKVLVHALLEGLDAFAKFFGIVCVYEFLEHGARV
jgi:hypothetical protein